MPHFIPADIPSRFKRIYNLYNAEHVEHYQTSGLHPIIIGDYFADGRYKVLHKLGHGISSTVWLARDNGGAKPGRLVALKALVAADSDTNNPEFTVFRIFKDSRPPPGIQIIDNHFLVDGPNGRHMFLVFPLAGPNVYSMSRSQGFGQGRVEGSRRLRGDLARKLAKQLVMMVFHMHSNGLVHGDITTRNIMFPLKPHVLEWSDEKVYSTLGMPVTEKVTTIDGTPVPPCAPAELVDALDYSPLMSSSHLEEDIILSDFGSSYAVNNRPSDYTPGTLLEYFPPEACFDNQASYEADVWELGCTIFELRAGRSLFYNYFNDRSEVLMQMVAMLGRFPEPWWEKFEDRSEWFKEDGEPQLIQNREGTQLLPIVDKTSIREQLRSIGTKDAAPSVDEGEMIEKTGVRLSEKEVALLGDLLEKMLRYRPEERIKMCEVIHHPWFAMSD